MATLTVQLEDELFQKLQKLAEQRHSSVDTVIAEALADVHPDTAAASEEHAEPFGAFLTRFAQFNTGGPYTRDQMNER